MLVDEIFHKYDLLESQLLYDKAVELMKCITDEELSELFVNYPELFQKLSDIHKTKEEILQDKESLQKAVELFTTTLKSRNLSLEQFNTMSAEEVREYISSLITYKRPAMLKIIHDLEVIKYDSRNSEN